MVGWFSLRGCWWGVREGMVVVVVVVAVVMVLVLVLVGGLEEEGLLDLHVERVRRGRFVRKLDGVENFYYRWCFVALRFSVVSVWS